MKTLGLDLDNSPHIAEDKSLRYALNVAIDKKGESYFNDPGFDFKTSLPEDHGNMTIIGTIPTNIGVVLFCYIKDGTYDSAILYYTTTDNVELKKIILGDFNFSIDHPIHGDYIYNYKEELIVTFTEGLESNNETRIINIYNPSYKEFKDGEYWYDDNNRTFEVESEDVTKYNLIPNVIFPTINLNVIGGGNLQTGAYQVAIAYKLYDGTYTNFSTLSPVSVISGDYESYNKIGEYVNNAIEVQLSDLDNSYEYFKLAIVYIDEESQIPYETEDIKISKYDNQSYIISSLKSYAQISLDDIFIKNISYIKDQTLINFNNRLIRANVRTLDINKYDTYLKEISKNINIRVEKKSSKDYYNTDKRYFKGNELYVFYIAFYDYKGDLINIYNIPAKELSSEYTIPYKINDEVLAHKIPDTVQEISNEAIVNYRNSSRATINETVININQGDFKPYGLDKTVNGNRTTEFLGYTQAAEEIRNNYSIIPANDFDSKTYDLFAHISNGIDGFYISNSSDVDITFKLRAYVDFRIDYDDTDKISGEVALVQLNSESSNYIKLISESINITDNGWRTIITHSFVIPKNTTNKYAFYTYIKSENPSESFAYTGKTTFMNASNPGDELPNQDDNFINILIPEFTNNANILIEDIKDVVKSYQFLFIEHNLNNSKILSQAFMMRDTGMNLFSNNQRYDYQFEGKESRDIGRPSERPSGIDQFGHSDDIIDSNPSIPYRLYPFEYLYNKISQFKANINIKYKAIVNEWITNTDFIFNTYNLEKEFRVISVAIDTDANGNFKYIYYDGTGSTKNGTQDKNNANVWHSSEIQYNNCATRLLYASINALNRSKRENINFSKSNDVFNINCINLNNSYQFNSAGDSYYRFNLLLDNSSVYLPFAYGAIVELENHNENLYSNLDNQSLQISSSIYHIDNIKRDFIELIGDTYLSQLTLRATTPARGYLYGDNNHKELDSNNYVWRWVFSVPIESKFNLKARFNHTQVDRSFKPTSADDPILKQLFNINYQIDNFINTSEGKGYSTIYNENGIEKFTYYPELIGTNNHPFRIIRSQEINAETLNLNWRLFKSNDYKDMPFNRGGIISLKTDNKTLYIQQQYGLNILQLRDTLSNTDEGTSYLESADIFNMDPAEILFSPTGYIGCENYFDTHLNAIGYFVIDVVHKNIFAIKGKEVQMISASNMKNWFFNNLKDNLNNPYKNKGRIWAFNEDTNTLYLAQNDDGTDSSSNSFTLSYSPIKNIWVSFHTFIPTTGFSSRNGLFWVKNGLIHKVSKSNFGRYFRSDKNTAPKIVPTFISILCNENPFTNKLIHTILWKDRVDTTYSGMINSNNFQNTINSIMIYNDHQCTDFKDVKFDDIWYRGLTGVNKVNLWRFNNINDVLKPNYRNIKFVGESNKMGIEVDSSATSDNLRWYNINRFICQFVNVVMKFNNEKENNRWELIDVMPEWIKDNRNK